MTRRTPARLLALFALVAVTAALYLVVSGGGADSEREARPEATTAQPSAKKSAAKRRRTKRTYTVRSGDTPSGIAEKTGVPVAKLLELNPDLDPQSLQTGVRLKLR